MVDNGKETHLLEFHAPELLPYLLFRIKNSVYGVHVDAVTEIVLLPELKIIAGRTSHFVGVVNLRGDIVPVMDLELRFGRKRGSCSVNDFLLVLQSGNQHVALIVNDVRGVGRIDPEQFNNDFRGADLGADATCIERMASVDDQIVMLLDIGGLLTSAGHVQADSIDQDTDTESVTFILDASAEDQAVFRRRADQLRQASMGDEDDGLTSLAIAEIGGEFYAFDLDFVREFFDVDQITPVPCCPPKIVGNVNLRGDVVTVIDVRRQLNLPAEGRTEKGKVIIAQTEELVVGVLVEALHGVFYLPASDITNVTSAVSVSDAPIKGTAPFRETMMSILDVPRLLDFESWVVDETVGHL